MKKHQNTMRTNKEISEKIKYCYEKMKKALLPFDFTAKDGMLTLGWEDGTSDYLKDTPENRQEIIDILRDAEKYVKTKLGDEFEDRYDRKKAENIELMKLSFFGCTPIMTQSYGQVLEFNHAKFKGWQADTPWNRKALCDAHDKVMGKYGNKL